MGGGVGGRTGFDPGLGCQGLRLAGPGGGDDDVGDSGLTVAEERGEGGRPVAARDVSMLAPRAYPSSSLSPWTASYSTLTLS